MIICPNCRAQQFDGTIFCLECGASTVLESMPESTRQIGAGDGPQTSGLTSTASAMTPMSGPPSVLLVVVRTGRQLRYQISDTLLIGRTDTTKGVAPDIDLGPEGGYDAGVSRRHAVISLHNGRCMIEDLGSANGTFVNGKRLSPQAVAGLRSGDELVCGTLTLRVEIT